MMSSKNRNTSADLVQLAGHPDTHPLKWAVPDSYDSLPAPRLLKHLTRLATRERLPMATTTRMLEDWLADAQRPESDPVWALEHLAWCHLLPRLAPAAPEDLWRALYDTLHSAVASAAGIVVHDDPVRHQLLSGELPLAMAFVLPELQAVPRPGLARLALAVICPGRTARRCGAGVCGAHGILPQPARLLDAVLTHG